MITNEVLLPVTASGDTRYRVSLWRDSVVEAHGWPVDSDAAERFWLPILGPTSLMLARFLVREVTRRGNRGEPYEVGHDDLSSRMGLSWKKVTAPPRKTKLGLALIRLAQFHVATVNDVNIAVRCMLPFPAAGQIGRWHPNLAAELVRWAAEQRAAG